MRARRLTIAHVASDSVLGAGTYQREILERAPEALAQVDPWIVDRATVRSLRSPQPGNRRLPLGAISNAPPAVRRAVGRSLYRSGAVVHRMSLELPPAPIDVVTLHDVVAWKFSDESPPVPAAIDELRKSAAIICVSTFSAEEAVETLGIDAPHVVHNGVDEAFLDAVPAPRATREALGISGPYIITTGGASERKNLAGLAAAWPRVRAARPYLQLVLTGPEHPRRSSLFAGLPGVRLTGLVGQALMPGLLAASEAVVVPSRYEGFGFPALEGMAVGVPVVAADSSSLPEVVGDGGLLVNPEARGIADGIIEATSDDPEVARMVARGRLRARQFSWERCLKGHASVWSAVGAGT